jgi:hypothetical protein
VRETFTLRNGLKVTFTTIPPLNYRTFQTVAWWSKFTKKISEMKYSTTKKDELVDSTGKGNNELIQNIPQIGYTIVSAQHFEAVVTAGSLITKEKRLALFGNVAGGAGSREPENFQRQKIVDGTGIACPKTNIRINLSTNILTNISRPNTKIDGFDYSEDFDGKQSVKGNDVYINLKCIVGKGGVQTRSLREVYWFVKGQLKSLKKNPKENVYFANILDGDEAHSTMSKFEYLLNLPKFNQVKERVYVGDLRGYFNWFEKVFGDE